MDEFGDDDFDDLNDSVFQELEDNAIQATQAAKRGTPHPQQQHIPPPPTQDNTVYINDDDDEYGGGFDDSIISNVSNVSNAAPARQASTSFARPPLPAPKPAAAVSVSSTTTTRGPSRVVPVSHNVGGAQGPQSRYPQQQQQQCRPQGVAGRASVGVTAGGTAAPNQRYPPVSPAVAAGGATSSSSSFRNSIYTSGAVATTAASSSFYHQGRGGHQGHAQHHHQQPQQQPIGTQFVRPQLPGTQSAQLVQESHYASQLGGRRGSLYGAAGGGPGASQSMMPPPSQQQNNMVEALKTRVRVLEAELNASRGEISIVRSKYDKTSHDHAIELQRTKKDHAQEIASLQDIANTAKHAEDSLATELQFAKNDLRNQADRNRRPGPGAPVGSRLTPRKAAAARTLGGGDGFDDDELMPSPSKSQGRAARGKGSVAPAIGERTPSKAKRKRPVVDSPLMPLDMVEDVVMHDGDETSEPHSRLDTSMPAAGGRDDGQLSWGMLSHNYIKLLLEHHTARGRPGTFEVLATYFLPSEPGMSFSNKYLHKIPDMGSATNSTSLLADFAVFTLELWNECLAQQYFEPASDLLALVSFALQVDIMIVPHIMSIFLPVAQSTCSMIADPRNDTKTDLTDEYHSNLVKHIDVAKILSVVEMVAVQCMTAPIDEETNTNIAHRQFWGMMDLRLIFLLLSYRQPRADYEVMVRLLRTSGMVDSIGAISPEADSTPAFVAGAMIDRLSQQLWFLPPWIQADKLAEKHKHQLLVLRTLTAFAASPFGIRQISMHSHAIARLAVLLCSAIEALYSSDIPLVLAVSDMRKGLGVKEVMAGAQEEEGEMEEEDRLGGKEETVYDLISRTMILLHTAITNPEVDILSNLKARLEVVPGTWQRYLVALARLEFSEEELVLERGIGGRTLDLGHELLDLVVTPNPEIEDQILEVFGDGDEED